MDIGGLEHSADLVITMGGAVAALTTIGVAVRYIWKGLDQKVFTPVAATMEKVSKNYASMEASFPMLVKMSQEFTPNCGSSLRDCINRMENNIDNLRATDHLLLEMSDIGHFETDGNGDCTWANKKYEEITGVHLIDLLGDGWISCIHPADREAVMEEWKEAFKGKRQFLFLFRYLRPDGETRSVRVQAVLNYNSKGVCIGALGSVFQAR